MRARAGKSHVTGPRDRSKIKIPKIPEMNSTKCYYAPETNFDRKLASSGKDVHPLVVGAYRTKVLKRIADSIFRVAYVLISADWAFISCVSP